MRLFKKLIASILIPTAILAAPFSVSFPETTTNTSVVLETTKLTDTFLVENIKETHVTTEVTEYRITNTNTIQGRGTYIAGTKNHTATDRWETILKDAVGTPLYNIVQISADYIKGTKLTLGVLVALSTEGDVYVGTSNTTHMTAVSQLKDITDVSVETVYVYDLVGGSEYYTIQYCISAIDSSGNLTRVYYGAENKVNPGVTVGSYATNSDRVYKNVYKSNGVPSVNDGQLPVYVLDSESNLYKVQGNEKISTSGYTLHKGISVGNVIASNVKDVSCNGDIYVLTNRGQLFYSATFNDISFTKNNARVTPIVHSIISASGSHVNSCFVYTDLGPALIQANRGYILDFGFTPVHVWYETNNKAYVMDDQGNIYSFTISTGITPDRFTKEEKEGWANQNPIIPIWNSVEFNIDVNQIIERNKPFDVIFKIVSNKTPIAFDIYYAKYSEIANRNLWKPIQQNVACDSLNPIVEETEYTDRLGQPINRITYTYNWDIPDGDLSNVQLIIDPIYQ